MSGNPPDPEFVGSAASFSTRPGEAAGAWTLVVNGEIDVATSPELRRELQQLIDRNASAIVIDMTAVSFIDSSGLGVLVGALKRLQEDDRGDGLVLMGLQDSVRKVFDITGLAEVFAIG